MHVNDAKLDQINSRELLLMDWIYLMIQSPAKSFNALYIVHKLGPPFYTSLALLPTVEIYSLWPSKLAVSVLRYSALN